MPDLSQCEYVDGKLLCWDKEHEMFVEVILANIYNRDLIKKATAVFMNKSASPKKDGG